jgi:hypothetical protein
MSKVRVRQWLNHNFESSSTTTPEFKSFTRDFKHSLNLIIKPEFEIKNFIRGHFYISGFLQNRCNGNYGYFSTSDVRFSPNDWFNNVLIRTAKHDKDYTGGFNNYCRLENIKETALKLTS